ncbi:MAG: hypothetical protein ABL911_10750, partial [Gallionella sp.]
MSDYVQDEFIPPSPLLFLKTGYVTYDRTVHFICSLQAKIFPLELSYPNEYTWSMNTFLRSDEFDAWLAGLKDKIGRARIIHRIRSAEAGNFGDCEPVGEGVSEMRIHV